PTGAGNDLQCHIDQLTGYALDALRHPGHIAPRPRIAREEMRDARIGEPEADDRERRRGPLECDGGAGRAGHQDVRSKRDQFACQRLELFDRAIAIVDIQIATLRVAQAAQAIDEGGVVLLQTQREERDPRTGVGRVGLLRARRERPGSRAAEQRYELAAPHSITLSARNTREGGTSKSITFAACRLIANSNLVGCSTGTSLTFSLLKTLASWRASCRNIWVMRGP